MIGRVYVGGISEQAQTSAKTLMTWQAASNAVMFIQRIVIKNTSNDSSDTTAAEVQRVTASSGTGTTSTSVVNPMNTSDTAFSGVFRTNFTAEPTFTSNTILMHEGFNVLTGLVWVPEDDDALIQINPSAEVAIGHTVAITSANLSYYAHVREIGG